ncbi:endolytic transglycosylase MltG [Methylophaga sp.]|uniref:endolytic transglycosylase MltG n=1 Tax=Methylophaga sp. TaxID=2024840 RepID=UPI0027188B61|nr:endolytic transglycosylase MltG [Methylophaga sp.]MDO8827069.1 endolytic transglycosylase MltG [Methylophaga sp.]
MKISLTIKLLFLLLLTAIIALVAWSEYQRFLHQPVNLIEDETIFTIYPGDNISKVSQRLYDSGLSPVPSVYLDIYARLQGNAQQIKAGEYRVQANATLPDLLNLFISGRVVQYSLTIVEGMTANQLFEKMLAHPKLKITLNELNNETVREALSIENDLVEGWFLPETYHFPANTTDVQFLRRAYQKMQSQLESAWQQMTENLPYDSAYEVLIMASIIEKESAIPQERPEIAGVFVRRLGIGMRLQTDPTVIYGMGDSYDGNIRKKDLQTDTPYNTYTRFGLPPTPICLPSKESIEAAMNPAEGTSLYFVAGAENGGHVFSDNLEDHNRAVRQYWNNMRLTR